MKRCLLLTLLLFSFFRSNANPPFGAPRYGFSYGASGVISLFHVDERHSQKAIPRPGFGATARLHFYPSTSVHIQIGIEVMSQACAFDSYYFAPGYSTFYDRSFGYTHTLRTVELYMPLLVRVGLTPGESTARNIFYLLAGYSPKLFLASSTNIVRDADGKGVWGGPVSLTYENWFIGPQTGNVMIAGMGLDKRLKFNERFLSFEAIFRYNLSRFTYDLGKTGNDPLLIKNMCISLQIGYRFAGGGRSGGVN